MSDATPLMVAIRATRLIDAGYVRIDAGEVAEIRAEHAPQLLDCGAAELVEPENAEAPASDTLPGGAKPDSAGASPVDAAEAPGEAAPLPADGEAPGGVAPVPAAAPATRKGKRA